MIAGILHILNPGQSVVRIFLPVLAVFFFFLLVYQSVAIQAEEKKTGENKPQVRSANIPGHEVQYEDTLSPDWKRNWDLARELYRDKKYREALIQYELLLSQKESNDEARWEYVTLLTRQKRWQQAGEQLEKLLVNDPDNMDYGFAMAEVYVNTGKADAAIELYGKYYISATEVPQTRRALEGLIRVLESEGRFDEVSFYLEKLIVLEPGNLALQIKHAKLVLESGQLDKARNLITKLEQNLPDNHAVLQLQVILQKKLDNRDAEAGYRQKLVAADPDDMESHAMLQQYYRDRENWAMSLKHLEMMLQKTPGDVDILENAADLNIRLDRIDRALEYYDYILALRPNEKNVFTKKKEARKALAEDLVVLVENDGGQKLWQDLVKVTADRLGVYREIANLLREKGNTNELIEVLTLICLEDQSDEKSLSELTALMKETGRSGELKDLLAKLHSTEPEN